MYNSFIIMIKKILVFINYFDFLFLLNVLLIYVLLVFYCILLLFGFFLEFSCKLEIFSKVEKEENLNMVVLLYLCNYLIVKFFFKKYVYIIYLEYLIFFLY